MDGKLKKNKAVQPQKPAPKPTGPTGFESIVGMETVKKQMRKTIHLLLYSGLAKTYKVGLSCGTNFYCPPCCGKSNFVNKFIQEVEKQTAKPVVAYQLSVGNVKSAYMHPSSINIVKVFDDAAKAAAKNCSIFVIGTTNHVDKMDPAVIRPGHFDDKVEVLPPDEVLRVALLKEFLKGVPVKEEINFANLAKEMDGLTIADIEALTKNACHTAMSKTIQARETNPKADLSPVDEAMIRSFLKKTSKLNCYKNKIKHIY